MPELTQKNKYIYLIIKILISFILLITTRDLKAQIFNSPQNPPFLKWKQIQTPLFQLIYPAELETEAQRMANTLERIIEHVSASLKREPRKISIILQNQGVIANGFVQLAPRRSEFFTTPPQEFDYQDWLNGLAVHELRHVVQFDRLTGEFKAPVENIALTIFGLTLPPWFFEGDAVDIETALTEAGRGRIPSWNIIFRSNTLSGKKFSYSKNYFGSVKDFTPGYYQLGYFLTTKLRRDYGSEVLNKLYDRMKKAPLMPYNFNYSLKKVSGLNTVKLHQKTVEELKSIWNKKENEIRYINYESLNKRINKTPEHYLLPVVSENGNTVYFLKESKADVPSIMRIDSNGTQRTVIKIGYQEESNFSYANGRIVWDEFRFDKRYQKRSFNVINRFDLSTKSYKQLTHKTRLFAPSLSPDGKTIIAVEVSYSNKIALVELDAESGKEVRRYESPGNLMLQTPRFDSSAHRVVVSAVSQQGKSILELDRNTGEFKQLIPFQKQLISRPSYIKNNILFKAHYNGIDNVYLLDTEKKKVYQITSARFGAINPSYHPSSEKIYFNNYQVKGYDITSISINQGSLNSIDSIKNPSIDYIDPVVEQEGNKNAFANVPNRIYKTEPFREINNLFYFHSILPILEENNYDNYNLGVKIQSDNKLNTLNFYAGYRFNNALKRSEYLSGFTYSRFYPIFNFSHLNQGRLLYRKTTVNGKTQSIPISWRENIFNAEIKLPFVFNQLNHVFNTAIKTGTSYTSRYDIENRPGNFIERLKFPVHYQAHFFHNNRRSARDLAPKWGQNLTLTYRHFPFDDKVKGEHLAFESNFYFPGIAKNHSFQASFNYQQGSGSYDKTRDIPLVSGYSFLQPTANLRNTLLFDYRFPIFYPDWEVGPLAYIKRFKGGFFADFENIGKGNPFSPRTYGAELRADMNLLRFFLPNFDLGGKIIFVNKKPLQNPIFESIITYNF